MTMNYASSYEFMGCGTHVTGDRDEGFDIVDLLPSDPFGMNLSSTLSVFADFMWDFGASSGTYTNYGFYIGETEEWFEYCVPELEPKTAPPPEVGPVESGYPEGMQYSLRYLGLRDLLAVECVSRSLRCAVQRDLPWKCIHIESPLSERIDDSALFSLGKKANGLLQCLSLVDCSNITDEGLGLVLEINPRLEKLSVSGCRRLSIEGLIRNLKAFSLKASNHKASKSLDPACKSTDPDPTGIKQLKLGRLFNLLPEHYKSLHSLLGYQPKSVTPRFYQNGVSPLACDDDRAIDIEMCPGCNNLKFVYDCPSGSCQARGPDHCRACEACIIRCAECGRCMKDCRYEETFLLDYICTGCLEAQSHEIME